QLLHWRAPSFASARAFGGGPALNGSRTNECFQELILVEISGLGHALLAGQGTELIFGESFQAGNAHNRLDSESSGRPRGVAPRAPRQHYSRAKSRGKAAPQSQAEGLGSVSQKPGWNREFGRVKQKARPMSWRATLGILWPSSDANTDQAFICAHLIVAAPGSNESVPRKFIAIYGQRCQRQFAALP